MAKRALVVAVLVVAFFVVAGVLIYANTRGTGPKNLTFDVRVTNGESMTPSDMQARQGDTITINVTSDREGEVHLHGYDLAFETKPGETASRTFKADRTCTCEIEWEPTAHELGTLEVSP